MLPEITHLQFLVLASLVDGECSGSSLRSLLESHGRKHTRAAFYQLMARLEDAEFVRGRYEKKNIEEVTITERFYVLTNSGESVIQSTREFYIARMAAFGPTVA